jgi:signal peptidase I
MHHDANTRQCLCTLYACHGVVPGARSRRRSVTRWCRPELHCAASPGCKSLTADHVLANRWIYRFRSVQRGDVVVIRNEGGWCGRTEPLIKRVIGTPGDRISVAGRAVYLNGRLVTPRLPYKRSKPNHEIRGRLLRVRPGQYFVVGDNTEVSGDSRKVGDRPSRHDSREGDPGLVTAKPAATPIGIGQDLFV